MIYRIGKEQKRMVSIPVKARVGPDGVLTLQIPTEFHETDVEGLLVLQPLPTSAPPEAADDLGWPPGFFAKTAGSIQDETFQRWPQGEYEVRKEL